MKTLVVLLSFLLCGCGETQSRFTCPSSDSVTGIEIDLENFPPTWKRDESFKFSVPPTHHEEILELFRGARFNDDPHKMETMGTVDIEHESEKLRISVYSDSRKRLDFHSGGSFYTGSSIEDALRVIQSAYSQRSEQGEAR